MSISLHYKNSDKQQSRPNCLRLLLCSAAILGAAIAPAAAADDAAKGSFRALTFNTWVDRFGSNFANMSNFFEAGNYDIIAFQELRNDGYLDGLSNLFKDMGIGTYTGARQGDSGVLFRLDGTGGNTVLEGNGGTGVNISYATLEADEGRPETFFGSIHLNYYDEPVYRIQQAKNLNWWADNSTQPLVIAGDFNAGDVSERGLNRSQQQALLYTRLFYDNSPSALWQQLGKEYAPEGKIEETQAYIAAMRAEDPNGQQHYRNVLQAYFDAHRDEFPGLSSTGDMSWQQWAYIVEKDMASNGLVLEDEMFPVESNTPVTVNILKKKYIFLQNEDAREIYQPLVAGDGISTMDLRRRRRHQYLGKLGPRSRSITSWHRGLTASGMCSPMTRTTRTPV